MIARICINGISAAIVAISAFLHQFAVASTLIEFDTPYIIAEEKSGKINGYYGLALPAVDDIRPAVSCNFFFTSSFRSTRQPTLTINTFWTNSTYANRHYKEDLAGELLMDRDNWTIRMDAEPAGCLSAAGGGFQKNSAIPNIIKRRTPIIGILIVKKKTNFYDLRGAEFSRRKGYLVSGDVIVAFVKKDGFYFVKFFNERADATSTGWLRISDTASPFPEASESNSSMTVQ